MYGLSGTQTFIFLDGTVVIKSLEDKKVLGKCVNGVWKLYVPLTAMKQDLINRYNLKGK